MTDNSLNIQENAKSDWMKIVNKHKKKQKGLPALSQLNTNAGNVEHNIKMFNMMQPSGSITVDASSGSISSEGSTCCESLDEALQSGYAYMLRNDGQLIPMSSNYSVHPYIIQGHTAPIFSQLRLLFMDPTPLVWLYNNTQKESTKRLVSHFVSILNTLKEKYNIVITDELIQEVNGAQDITSDVDESYVEETFKFLDVQLNQEFCRVRTSHLFKTGASGNDIYFRISSVNFNWFDLIWSVVYENKDWIKTVTIVTDFTSKGEEKYYTCSGVLIKELPVEDFITLPGNPIIEQYLTKTNVFNEGYFEQYYKTFNPTHVNRTSNFMLSELYEACFKEGKQMNNETIVLEYDALPIRVTTRRGSPKGYYDYSMGAWYPDEDTKETLFVSWDYEVQINDVLEYLQELPEVQIDLNYGELSSKEYDDAVLANFDILLDKYDKILKAHFRSAAKEDAQKNYSYDYEYKFEESYKETKNSTDTSNLDDQFDMSMRTLL